jgi:hypothetical protein
MTNIEQEKLIFKSSLQKSKIKIEKIIYINFEVLKEPICPQQCFLYCLGGWAMIRHDGSSNKLVTRGVNDLLYAIFCQF